MYLHIISQFISSTPITSRDIAQNAGVQEKLGGNNGYTIWALTKWLEKKIWWEFHKNAASSFEQTLDAAPDKAAIVQSLASHFKNHPSKMTKTFSSSVWTLDGVWMTCNEIMDDRNGRWEKIKGMCYELDLMMNTW